MNKRTKAVNIASKGIAASSGKKSKKAAKVAPKSHGHSHKAKVHPIAAHRKGPGKEKLSATGTLHHIHHLNLRCGKNGCVYYAKTTPEMLEIARLKCPIHGTKLLTKDERGETRGRSAA